MSYVIAVAITLVVAGGIVSGVCGHVRPGPFGGNEKAMHPAGLVITLAGVLMLVAAGLIEVAWSIG